MTKSNGKRKQSITSKVKDVLLKRTTISIHVDNEQGFKRLTDLTAWYLLEDAGYNGAERILRIAEWLPHVRNVFHVAMKELDDDGQPVFRGPEEGRLEWVTLDKSYRQAPVKDTHRTAKRMDSTVKCGIRHLAHSDPKSLPLIQKRLGEFMTKSLPAGK